MPSSALTHRSRHLWRFARLPHEDHTLGNALRFMLNKKYAVHRVLPLSSVEFRLCSRSVSFCGYSIPHPLETKLNVHVQTTGTPFSP
jgi:DNA-directed RNA polymerase I and III subunit RPAC2